VNLLSLLRLAELYPDVTGHPDRNGTGTRSGFDNHVLFWNQEQFKKTFITASSGLPKCLFNSGYSRLEAFSTILSSFYDDKIRWALASKEKINELANKDENILEIETIKAIIEFKWEAYTKKFFSFQLFLMLIFTLAFFVDVVAIAENPQHVQTGDL
jgi:hypothetical protein